MIGKKKYLILYWMLKCYVRHVMVIGKVYNVISFKQSKWLEKYMNFDTQKSNKAKNDFEKCFYKLLNNNFYGKTMEIVRNRFRIEFNKTDVYERILKEQSKLTFNGIHKSHENFDSYTFKQNEVLMDKPIYLGFSELELSKLLMYETYNDKSQPYIRQESLTLHFMDCDGFVLSIETQNEFNDLKSPEDLFVFSNLNDSPNSSVLKTKKS